jgi:hypothetical protein
MRRAQRGLFFLALLYIDALIIDWWFDMLSGVGQETREAREPQRRSLWDQRRPGSNTRSPTTYDHVICVCSLSCWHLCVCFADEFKHIQIMTAYLDTFQRPHLERPFILRRFPKLGLQSCHVMPCDALLLQLGWFFIFVVWWRWQHSGAKFFEWSLAYVYWKRGEVLLAEQQFKKCYDSATKPTLKTLFLAELGTTI